jgi:uncharacterized protein YjbJ (UPF0337 family)
LFRHTSGQDPVLNGRRAIMGDEHTSDRAKAALDDAKGKVKETAGRVTDDEDLEREGRRDQVKSDAKRAASHVKDAAENVKEGARDAFDDD